MKNSVAVITVIMLLLSTNLTAQKVTGDYDKSTDFSKYKTYQFVGWQKDSEKVMNEFDKKRLREAILAEMTARQFTLVESGADMGVSLYIVVDKKTSTTAYTDFYGGAGYGRGRRAAGGWGYGSASTTYSDSDYLEGTLVLDFLDESSKDLIWQGVATGTINQNPDKREKSIPKSVKKLMKKFPVDP
ncbi:DUF4136 domain-containing protein, partial [Lutimonas sp.]|uniref:DUF4136 domain-containing protein n=1 Tax=Lutimonas sp. TaxID=1872403 RepID=UPI003D9B9027